MCCCVPPPLFCILLFLKRFFYPASLKVILRLIPPPSFSCFYIFRLWEPGKVLVYIQTIVKNATAFFIVSYDTLFCTFLISWTFHYVISWNRSQRFFITFLTYVLCIHRLKAILASFIWHLSRKQRLSTCIVVDILILSGVEHWCAFVSTDCSRLLDPAYAGPGRLNL